MALHRSFSALRGLTLALSGLFGLSGLSGFGGGAALARPELVVLIRHGHKDRASGVESNNYNLSAIGQRQALQLGAHLPACLDLRPQTLHLASYGFDLDTGKNARSYQTLVPLAVASGRNIKVFADAERASEAIGRRLLDDPAYAGTSLVIAWEHRRLPLLAKGLGWDAMPSIDDDDFDGIWLLRYRGDVQAPRVQVGSQSRLLARCGRGAASDPPERRP